MTTGEIRVDVARLLDIAADLRLAHTTLAGSPAYTELNAGDRAGRVPGAVEDFIGKNRGPRERLVQQLDAAHRCTEAAAIGFGENEAWLVRALEGNE